MSLVGDYSCSESDGETPVKKDQTNSMIVLDSESSNTTKTVAGTYQNKIIDATQFTRNKRLYENGDSSGNDEMKRMKMFNETKATKAKSKEFYKNQTKKSKGDILNIDVDENSYKGSWASSDSSSAEEDKEINETQDSEPQAQIPSEAEETSRFYGNKSKNYNLLDTPADYQVRFAMTIPGQKEYFVPKKLLSSYKAHKSAITSLKFFPNTGHTLLSSGNDGMIKLWSVTNPKKLLRDYNGHQRPVKHTEFSPDGDNIISCSYDKTVKVWDTETGKVLRRTTVQTNPNMCCFVPNNPNEYMVALDGKRVEHYDLRTGDSVQTYEHHESSVTWIEFLNDGKQFITASDDRSLKIWDMKINMPIKYIQDPKQQAIPVVKKHPNGKWFAGQSMDNQVLVYSTDSGQKFKKNNNKVFTGHKCAAYAIKMGFTPDGKTLFSGDCTGYCYFWDWQTTQVVSRIKVSNEVISNVDVHPLENSLYSMAGYDGNIYLYS